jgi:hypothetical protein
MLHRGADFFGTPTLSRAGNAVGEVMNVQKFHPYRSPINPAGAGADRGACAFIALVALAALAMAGPASGKAAPKTESGASLAGSWSGGGWVSFSSGNKERARCRAHYSRAGGSSYALSATCATASGSASQTATVYQVGPNRFRGSFHNVEYNISGSIRIVVSGNSQSVTLAGEGASASLSLSRR